jgi:two-component system OmpR family response regulator
MAVRTGKIEARSSSRLRILIVEDARAVAAALQAGLHAAGMTTDLAETGAEAIIRKGMFGPDVVLVDLALADGAALVERFAAAGDCGVIALGAGAEEGKGAADDFVVRPVRMQELVNRIRAVHRRKQRPAERASGAIVVDRARHRLIGPSGSESELTEAELAVLETLLDAEGISVSREWLSRVALKRELRDDDRSVDRLVLGLRHKLTEQGAARQVIQSVRRQGYVLPDARPFQVTPRSRCDRPAQQGRGNS